MINGLENLNAQELYERGFEVEDDALINAWAADLGGVAVAYIIECNYSPRWNVEVYSGEDGNGWTMGQGYADNFADAWREATDEARGVFDTWITDALQLFGPRAQ